MKKEIYHQALVKDVGNFGNYSNVVQKAVIHVGKYKNYSNAVLQALSN